MIWDPPVREPRSHKNNPEFEIALRAFNMGLRERNDTEFHIGDLARTVDWTIQSQLLYQARSMNFSFRRCASSLIFPGNTKIQLQRLQRRNDICGSVVNVRRVRTHGNMCSNAWNVGMHAAIYAISQIRQHEGVLWFYIGFVVAKLWYSSWKAGLVFPWMNIKTGTVLYYMIVKATDSNITSNQMNNLGSST